MFSKIVISGGWSYGNLGDEMIAVCTKGLIDKYFPDVDKIYTSYDVEDFQAKHGIPAIESVHSKFVKQNCGLEDIAACIASPGKYGLTEFNNCLDHNTLFIMAGGGYFDGNWYSQFAARIVEIELAVKAGAKAVIWGQSIGPFTDDTEVKWLKGALEKCSYINVRDDSSKSFIQRLLPERRITCTPDSALLISDFRPIYVSESSEEPKCNLIVQIYNNYQDNGVRKKPNIHINKVAKRITLRLYRYNIAWVLLIRKLSVKLGMQCKIILNVQKTAKVNNNHFEKYARQLRKWSGCKEIEIVNDTDLDTFCKELAKGDAIISCKMHPLIVSASYGVPVYAISQHYKIDAFMEWIGRGDKCHRNSSFFPDKIFRQVQNEMHEKHSASTALINERKQEIYAVFEELRSI